jgi:hypothetical protein
VLEAQTSETDLSHRLEQAYMSTAIRHG